jgi:hypothetical protein
MSTDRPWHFFEILEATPFVAPPSEPKMTVMLMPAPSAKFQCQNRRLLQESKNIHAV